MRSYLSLLNEGEQGKAATDAACAGECERGVQAGSGSVRQASDRRMQCGSESSQAIPQTGGKGNKRGGDIIAGTDVDHLLKTAPSKVMRTNRLTFLRISGLICGSERQVF